jgi:thiosulfate/3-mercaptopyruvate sulfurtransferase
MLISAPMLAQALADKTQALVVADCRHDLMNHAAGRQAYDQGHVPGAVFIDMEHGLAAARTGKNGRHPLPSLEATRHYLASLGLTPSSHLVVYDAGGGMYALRLWWMARWAGITNVQLLDGGIGAWQSTGQALETVVPAAPKPSETSAFGALTEKMPKVNVSEVMATIGTPTRVVVDARMATRYRGENETIDPVAGHIPGALNRFFQTNLQANGLFKSPKVLHEEFTVLLGSMTPEQVIHQCGSGVTACHNIFAMELAGLPGSALYPGSWSEWVSDPTRPVALG